MFYHYLSSFFVNSCFNANLANNCKPMECIKTTGSDPPWFPGTSKNNLSNNLSSAPQTKKVLNTDVSCVSPAKNGNETKFNLKNQHPTCNKSTGQQKYFPNTRGNPGSYQKWVLWINLFLSFIVRISYHNFCWLLFFLTLWT